MNFTAADLETPGLNSKVEWNDWKHGWKPCLTAFQKENFMVVCYYFMGAGWMRAWIFVFLFWIKSNCVFIGEQELENDGKLGENRSQKKDNIICCAL